MIIRYKDVLVSVLFYATRKKFKLLSRFFMVRGLTVLVELSQKNHLLFMRQFGGDTECNLI